MVTCPPRLVPLFAATINETVPFDVLLCADATVIHETVLVALQEHPVSVDTATVSGPPPGPIVSLVRLRSYRQTAAAWLSWT